MRFRSPQKYLATQDSVIQALRFNSLGLLAFYSCSKTVEVSLSYTRIMERLCVLVVVVKDLYVHACGHGFLYIN